MPDWFLVAFGVVAAVGVALRWATRGHWSRTAGPGGWADVVLVGLGAVGLAYHCGAMFHPSTFDGAASLGGYAGIVQRLQTGSMVAYAVPALLLVLGVRRTRWWYVVVVAASLAVVGVTMYDGAALDTHLAAIFVAVTVVELGVALLLRRPRGRRPVRSSRAATA